MACWGRGRVLVVASWGGAVWLGQDMEFSGVLVLVSVLGLDQDQGRGRDRGLDGTQPNLDKWVVAVA